MKCQKCSRDFPKNEIEESHDIPKYLGGKDKDGRHNLCVECHDRYEGVILIRTYKKFFGKDILFWRDRRKNIEFMNELKNLNNPDKNKIALEIREKIFGNKNNKN